MSKTAEISQKEVIDLRKNNPRNNSSKGLRTPDVDLDPDAPDSPIEVENRAINVSLHFNNSCAFGDVYKDLKEEFGDLYTTTFFNNQMCIATI